MPTIPGYSSMKHHLLTVAANSCNKLYETGGLSLNYLILVIHNVVYLLIIDPTKCPTRMTYEN